MDESWKTEDWDYHVVGSMGKNLDFLTQCLGSSLYICLVGPNILFSTHSMRWDLTLGPNISAVGSPIDGYVVGRAILPN